MRNLEQPGRSVVQSRNGMAATSHPLSTITAIRVLMDGGNAMDAAIAACAVQCVVEPQSTGIGGDNFCMYAPGGLSSNIVAYNGSGRAPAKATAAWYKDQGITEIEQHTPHAVTIPGVIDAWTQLLADHGSKSLGDIFQYAIGYARDGYPIHQRIHHDWSLVEETLRDEPTAAELYLVDGKTPAVGSVHRQLKLAASLEHIAEHGRDGFYQGKIAEDIVSYLQGLGGLHTLEDFAHAKGNYITPIRTDYHGYDIVECSPNGQGIVALAMINILKGLDLGSHAPLSAERLHLEIEAARLAYGDRDAVLADPDQSDIPVAQWLSKEHAAANRARIDAGKAMAPAPASGLPAHHDTVYITVVDKDRNACSFINTLFNSFGSGKVAPQSGITLHNRGQGFVIEEGHPNCIAPNKRPLHTIIPGMAVKDDKVALSFGVMGGHYQACGHAHVLSNILEYGMDVQEAIDFPRVFPVVDSADGEVEVETSVPQDVQDKLTAMGHTIVHPNRPIGGSQAIQIDWENGTLSGGSDPRKDGCAIGY